MCIAVACCLFNENSHNDLFGGHNSPKEQVQVECVTVTARMHRKSASFYFASWSAVTAKYCSQLNCICDAAALATSRSYIFIGSDDWIYNYKDGKKITVCQLLGVILVNNVTFCLLSRVIVKHFFGATDPKSHGMKEINQMGRFGLLSLEQCTGW